MEYASKGTAGAGLGLGIAGTALGLLNNNGLGLLGGRWDNGYGNRWDNGCGNRNGYGYDGYDGYGADRRTVSRETFDVNQQLMRAQMDNAILSADLASEKKMVEVYNAATRRTNEVRDELMGMVNSLEHKVDSGFGAQSVINCQTGSAVNLLQAQVGQLYGLTKMVIPNTAVCPGWGTAEVSIAAAPATTPATT